MRLASILLLLAAPALPASADVTLIPARVGAEDVSGDGQAAEAGMELGRPLAVQVLRRGQPVSGIAIRFSILSEPAENRFRDLRAKLTDTLATTDRTGVASTRLLLGAGSGDYRVQASAGGRELVLRATGLRRRWYLVTIVESLGGLCLFLFGLYYGSKGLRRLAGNRLREVLFSLTARRVLGALVGIGVTAVFQSSSATITLLVGMASAGLLTLGQSLGVILGADIGTTVTVQLLAFRLFDYALIIAVAGFVLMNSWRRLRDAGQAVFGFGLVFYSLKVVLAAAEPLRSVPQVQAAVTGAAAVPWLALLFAVLLTGLLRSSAATIGIVVGLSFTGLIDLKTAIPFILGANIGTTFNAIIASWRGTTEARRIAAGHVLFKLMIVALIIPFLGPLARLIAATAGDVPRQIANAHTLINVAAAVIFLPLLAPYQRLLKRLVPDRGRARAGPRYLDPAALEAPELAVAQVTREVLRMGDKVEKMFTAAIPVFVAQDKEGRRRLVADDDAVDELEQGITTYLARISQEGLSPELSRRMLSLFYITGDLEHVADLVSKNLMSYARKRINEGLAFSEEGLAELVAFHAEVRANLEQAVACIATWDSGVGRRLAQAKDWGLERKEELHRRHMERLSRGLKETLDTSTVHLDFLADLERVNFHCSQIGAAVAGIRGRRPG